MLLQHLNEPLMVSRSLVSDHAQQKVVEVDGFVDGRQRFGQHLEKEFRSLKS
jgi:hypothetical protein